jgi:hypothetical protein
MQTKSSYRVLKWTFILGAMATLGSACVVTSGDDDDEPGDGGESGSTAEAGKTSTAGTGGTSTAGKGGNAGSAGTGTTPAGGAGGAGGAGEVYMAGLCDAAEPDITKGISPTMFPSCAASANDVGDDKACKRCLKDECCEAWQICYGSEPHIACGWGPTDADDDLGQWDCLQNCFLDNDSGATDPDELLGTCSAACTNQCEADDGGNLLVATAELIKCANKPATCQAECFPFN